MPGHDDPITQSDGPSPTDEDEDSGRSLEDFISDMDRPLGAEDAVTADEQVHGDTIEDYTRREERTARRHDPSVDLIDDGDEDGYDGNGEMTGDLEPGDDGPASPEQAAMHIVDQAPGAVDHPDDYVDPATR